MMTPNSKIELKTPENNRTEKEEETEEFFQEQTHKSKQL